MVSEKYLRASLYFGDSPNAIFPWQAQDTQARPWYLIEGTEQRIFRLHIGALSRDDHVNGNQADALNNGFNGDQRFFSMAARNWTLTFAYDFAAEEGKRLDGTKAKVDPNWAVPMQATSIEVDVIPAYLAGSYPYTSWETP